MFTIPTFIVPSEREPWKDRPWSESGDLLADLLNSAIILPEDWHALSSELQEHLEHCPDAETLLSELADHRLLTPYQAQRIRAGQKYGLVLGNYRILDRIGVGGMAVVFKAEHVEMRRVVAIKVLPVTPDQHEKMLPRFIAEMRTIAQLQHPNIVAAFDAGKVNPPDPDSPILRYIVMEYVPGVTLEEHVKKNGRVNPVQACDIVHQIASALVEAHKLDLVHRDVKPSNILITPEGQAKLLDFGLVRQHGRNLTEAGAILGTLDFMAPEQTQDASKVDIRTDLYGLGGTLYWCLTGQAPFPSQGTLTENLCRRLLMPPPSPRKAQPEISVELDAVVQRLMAIKPEDRFAHPRELMRALLPFLKPESRDQALAEPRTRETTPATGEVVALARKQRALIVDDEPTIREFCRVVLGAEGIECEEAEHGVAALAQLKEGSYDLLLVDQQMPHMKGIEVLQRVRAAPTTLHQKIVMMSGQSSADEMAKMLLAGADDFLTKPFSLIQLKSRVHAALRLKTAQDHADHLNQHLLHANAVMERSLNARDADLVQARNSLVLALAKLVEQRDAESAAHLMRLQRYCRVLAEQAAGLPVFQTQLDRVFIEMLECCVPLHDIGKVGLPDCILLKPGKLTADERVLMQAHTTIGADTLKEVASQHGAGLAFLAMAIDIARHHHERYDGAGYPDRLVGDDIPVAARIVTIADVYDALRSKRVYKPSMSHGVAVQVMLEACTGQFDPVLLQAFAACADRFEKIFQEVPG